MSRLDWKRGRFHTDYEVNEIAHGLRGYQGSQIQASIEYWRFDRQNSEMDDIFDEGVGAGKVYRPSVILPALHVTHNEGGSVDGDTGFYFNDDLYVTMSYTQFTRTGLTEADIRAVRYLKDRVLYDEKVFRVTQVNVLGQIKARDIIISIEGTQVKPDEMANDPQFAEYAIQPFGYQPEHDSPDN